jgi:hypothetical protein
VNSILQFRLERGGGDTKHCQKIQRARLGSIGMKLDMTRQCDDVGRGRDNTGEGKGRRRC